MTGDLSRACLSGFALTFPLVQEFLEVVLLLLGAPPRQESADLCEGTANQARWTVYRQPRERGVDPPKRWMMCFVRSQAS